MTRLIHHLLAIVILLGVVRPGLAQLNDRDLTIRHCTQCHGLDYYITPRSRKAWELTVHRMRDYLVDGAGGFTRDEADRIVDHLAQHFGEDSLADPVTYFADDPPALPPTVAAPVAEGAPETPPVTRGAQQPAATATVPAAVADEVAEGPDGRPASPQPIEDEVQAAGRPAAPRADISVLVRQRLENPPWRPGPGLLMCAELGGYGAVLCLGVLLVTGHRRKRLGTQFRSVHRAAALGLFLALCAHGIIHVARFGHPAVLWYWAGIVSFALIVAGQLQGMLRHRMGRAFLRLHIIAGHTALALAIIHWVWAWVR